MKKAINILSFSSIGFIFLLRVVEINGVTFDLPKDDFGAVNANEDYTIVYLPNSKHVIDVIDEDGGSLSQK